MNKIIYVIDNNEKTNYKYNIEEDTIIYHFSINGSSDVEVNLIEENDVIAVLSKTLIVGTGNTYRVRSAHYAATDVSSSWTDNLTM